MTDYTKATGSSGTMMLRDTGTVVEYWLRAGSGTYNYQLPWGYTINGITNNDKEFRFEMGGLWQKLGGWTVTTSQTVVFRLFDTGTSGLGGPTTLSANISRSTAPAAPSPVGFTNVSSTTLTAAFSDGANNGAAIDSRQIAYGLDPNQSGMTLVASDGSTDMAGFDSGVTYHFWARTHNINGYSPWSVGSSVTMLRVPNAPAPPSLAPYLQTSVMVSFGVATDNGGSPITEYRVGYGTSPTSPTSSIIGSPGAANQISGLNPGTVYYFWLRTKNVVGYSPWSNPRSIRTTAGARVKVGGVWKEAVPYVRSGGVWRLARPWVRIMGVWKQTN